MTLHLYRASVKLKNHPLIINPLSNCSYPGDSKVQKESRWLYGDVHESVFSYGNAKRFVYVVSKNYHKQYGIKTNNFLVPNAYGPGDSHDPNKTHALNGMIIRMLKLKNEKDSEFEIWGTGKPIREWIYVDDIARILISGMNISDNFIFPVNVGQNKGYSIRETAEIISQSIDFKGKLSFNDQYQDGAPVKILDNNNFKKSFPNFKFSDHSEGIIKTVKYYKRSFK